MKAEFETAGLRLPDVEPLGNLFLNLWLCYHALLAASSYEQCVISDSKDVLFQRDPFDAVLHDTERVLLVEEGLSYADSPWNQHDRWGLCSSLGLLSGSDDWRIVNGGVQIGPAAKLKAPVLAMYTTPQRGTNGLYRPAFAHYLHVLLKYYFDYCVLTPVITCRATVILTPSRH